MQMDHAVFFFFFPQMLMLISLMKNLSLPMWRPTTITSPR